MASKEYGLILSSKNKATVQAGVIKRPSIFDEDSDSDETSVRPTGLKQAIKRQDRVVQEKAVEEDPTVFQYDEIYDEMDNKRKESKLSRKDLDKKPKYISRLLVAADRRKRENERRIERQVQKEREAEGEEFKDKESFVTSAYKKKLEELKELEEQEKREEYLESIGDVRKQGNLDGFYRHLYEQKLSVDDDKTVKIEPKPSEEIKIEETIIEKPNSDAETTKTVINSETKSAKKRRYRRREDSKSEESEGESKDVGHLPSNLDADSDFSIDSDESDSETEPKDKKIKKEAKTSEETETTAEINASKIEPAEIKNEVVEEDKKEEKVVEKKPKIDIWKKRTVGVVFDEAVQRYFQRKAMRESG